MLCRDKVRERRSKNRTVDFRQFKLAANERNQSKSCILIAHCIKSDSVAIVLQQLSDSIKNSGVPILIFRRVQSSKAIESTPLIRYASENVYEFMEQRSIEICRKIRNLVVFAKKSGLLQSLL